MLSGCADSGGGGEDAMTLPEGNGYYWFKGSLGGFRFDGLVQLTTERDERCAYALGWSGRYKAEMLEGEWWGALVSPWEEKNGET